MLSDEEYRRRRDSARRDRDGDLGDIRRMLAEGDIGSPGKRAGADRVHEFDVVKRDLTYIHMCGTAHKVPLNQPLY